MRLALGDLLRSREKTNVPSDATISDTPQNEPEQRVHVQHIDIQLIKPNPFQPRTAFQEDSVAELAQSIKEHGLLHPIVVRQVDSGFELLMGERRLRACKSLGMEKIQAIVRQVDDRDAAILALVENLQREELTLLDEVRGLHRLVQQFSLSQTDVANVLGLSQSAVANKMRLNNLSEDVWRIISREMLSERHARALLKIKDSVKQKQAAQHIADHDMTVRQAEEWIANELLKETEPLQKNRQVIRGVYKDARLFVNSVRSLVEQLEESGIHITIDEDKTDDYVEVRVRIRTREEVS